MNYKTAKELNKRVFYEEYTDTIRTCPENYCVAVRRNGQFSCAGFDLDGALSNKRGVISLTIAMHQAGSTGGGLAEAISQVI